jgi:hypothetical protein
MTHLAPTEASARALIARRIDGPILMLNLLRFRDLADYSANLHLAPARPITGAEAYALYAQGIAPLLAASGGAVLLEADAGAWFIGPETERWDRVLIVRQSSLTDFFAFAVNPLAQEVLGHRTAALADSRLLPLADALPIPSAPP